MMDEKNHDILFLVVLFIWLLLKLKLIKMARRKITKCEWKGVNFVGDFSPL